MNNTPRRGTTIAHIGIAVRDLDAILPFYRNVLQLQDVELDDADGARIAGLAAGDSLVELLESPDPASPIGKFVAARGPGPASRATPTRPATQTNRQPLGISA